MNELEATRAKLKCLEMVEGTGLDWWNVVKLNGSNFHNKIAFDGIGIYELALGIIEGKPVWKGDTYYYNGYRFTANLPMEKLYYLECSWNPQKIKTVIVEMRVELVDYCSKLDISMCPSVVEEVAGACRKALEGAK